MAISHISMEFKWNVLETVSTSFIRVQNALTEELLCRSKRVFLETQEPCTIYIQKSAVYEVHISIMRLLSTAHLLVIEIILADMLRRVQFMYYFVDTVNFNSEIHLSTSYVCFCSFCKGS